MRRTSTPPRSVLSLALLAVLLAGLAALVGCRERARLTPLTLGADGPIGSAEYEETLREGAGATIRLDQLIAAADEVYRRVERRMDQLVAPEHDDWRPAFAELSQRAPETVPDLLDDYRAELAKARRFVDERGLVTLPDRPLEVVEAQNVAVRQAFPLALYIDGRLGVTTSASSEPDPAYLVNHCFVCIAPLAVHEGYPGHHVGFSRLAEPLESPPPELEQAIAAHSRNMFFLEGWGLYAELLMIEQGYYRDDPAAELGAWRAVLHRALRARLDAELHVGAISEEEAIRSYQRELLMTEDAARTEVRRHLDQPGNKATYFVGLLQILELRDRVLEDALTTDQGSELRRFHDRLLQWPMPIAESARTIFGIELARFGEGGLRALDELLPVAGPEGGQPTLPELTTATGS